MNRAGWIGLGVAAVLLAVFLKYENPLTEKGPRSGSNAQACLDCHRQ